MSSTYETTGGSHLTRVSLVAVLVAEAARWKQPISEFQSIKALTFKGRPWPSEDDTSECPIERCPTGAAGSNGNAKRHHCDQTPYH